MMSEESLAEALMAKHTNGQIPGNEHPVDDASSDAAQAKPRTVDPIALNVKSLESFPALGSGRPSPSLSAVWSVGNGTHSNGSTSPAVAADPSLSKPAMSSTGHSSIAARSNTVTDLVTLKESDQDPRARASLGAILARTKRKTDTLIDSSTSKMNGNTTFVIKGSPENVAKAKRELWRSLSITVKKTFSVPASARYAIIGPKGSHLRPIVEKSACQIQIGKADSKSNGTDTATSPAVEETADDIDEFEEESIPVTVEGDREGVNMAYADIMALADSVVVDVTAKIASVNERFFPFIEKEAALLAASTAGKTRIVTGLESVLIKGEKSAVKLVKKSVQALIEKLSSKEYSTLTQPLPIAKQRFLPIEEIFEQHEVVVTLPKDPRDSVDLFGATPKLVAASRAIVQCSNALALSTLVISKAHDKSVSHARNIARFFAASGKLVAIEKESAGVSIFLSESPAQLYDDANTSVTYGIIGPSGEKVQSARKSLIALVNQFDPAKVLEISDIDAFFVSHIEKHKREEIEKLQSSEHITVVLPKSPQPRPSFLFVYENAGTDEDFALSSAEIQNNLMRAQSEFFEDIRKRQAEIVSQLLTVPATEHKFIMGPKNTTLNAILKRRSGQDQSHGNNSEPLAQVLFGKPSFQGALSGETYAEMSPDSVYVRGTKNEVKRVIDEILQCVEDGKNYEELSNYTTDFKFPLENVRQLIGKQGANLAKLQEEFNVKINISDDGSGVVKGIKKNADEARHRIMNLGRRLADEVTLYLDIPNEFHGTMKGAGGSVVRRLEDKYDVRIQFPKSSELQSGDSKNRPRHKDEVVVQGPSRGAAKVKEEFMELLQYEKDHNHVESIVVPTQALYRIIGKNGEMISDIKDTTNTRIDIQDKYEGNPEKSSITVKGSKKGIKEALERIRAISDEIEQFVSETIEINPQWHRDIIGPGGSVMKNILLKAGGADGTGANAEIALGRTIKIPKADSNDPKIVIQGNKKIVTKVIKQIRDIVQARENEVVSEVPVAKERHGIIVGPGGFTRQELESEFGVTISVPLKGSNVSHITVRGAGENVQRAAARIQTMTQDRYKAEVLVPLKYDHALSEGGIFMRNLKTSFGVQVDHGRRVDPGVQKFHDDVPKNAINLDEDAQTTTYKWTVVLDDSVTKSSDDTNATIPWRLRGDKVEEALEAIKDRLEQVKKHDATGYLRLHSPASYRNVIGTKGATINNIREKSGCLIQVPTTKDPSPVLVIRGTQDGLIIARDLLLETLKQETLRA